MIGVVVGQPRIVGMTLQRSRSVGPDFELQPAVLGRVGDLPPGNGRNAQEEEGKREELNPAGAWHGGSIADEARWGKAGGIGPLPRPAQFPFRTRPTSPS